MIDQPKVGPDPGINRARRSFVDVTNAVTAARIRPAFTAEAMIPNGARHSGTNSCQN